MEDFFRENYSFITRAVEFSAALIGLFCWQKYKHSPVKYFILFLVGVALLEIFAGYPKYFKQSEMLSKYEVDFTDTLFESNYWLFTIFWTFGGTVFISFYYRRILSDKTLKNILKYVTIVFMIFTIAYYSINFELLFRKSAYSGVVVLGALIVLFGTVSYFIEVLKSDRILNFYKSIDFYISVTIFIWWLVITPISFYNIYFTTADWNFIILKWEIYLFANIFMYGMFSFALLWCKPQNN